MCCKTSLVALWINLPFVFAPVIIQLSINAFDYNCHVDLIKLLKHEGELLRLRKARQKMSELFPLTEGWFMLGTVLGVTIFIVRAIKEIFLLLILQRSGWIG